MTTTNFRRFAAGLCFVAVACSAAVASTHIPRPLRRTVTALRVVAFPALLPTTFDGIDLDHDPDPLFIRTAASVHRYEVSFDDAADCRGGHICSEGSFTAYDDVYARAHPDMVDPVGPQTPTPDLRGLVEDGMLILDRRVVLAKGRIGYYSEGHSAGDDGGSSSLRWHDGNVEYEIDTRISRMPFLVRTANSAIENGPLYER